MIGDVILLKLTCGFDYTDIAKIAFTNIQGNAYCLLPSNFLLSMLKSADANIRKLALERILKIRQNGTTDCKERRIPKINFEAKYWYELIDISDEFAMVEPPTSKFLSDDVLKSCIEMSLKPDIIDLPSHS